MTKLEKRPRSTKTKCDIGSELLQSVREMTSNRRARVRRIAVAFVVVARQK